MMNSNPLCFEGVFEGDCEEHQNVLALFCRSFEVGCLSAGETEHLFIDFAYFYSSKQKSWDQSQNKISYLL